MHRSFLKYLVDPVTKAPLELTVHRGDDEFVDEGLLTAGNRSYPIVRGVPRFAGYQDRNNYAKSFSYQWNKWSRLQFDSENVGKPMANHTRHMWERITGLADADLQGKVVADFGCGPGRFIETVRAKGGVAIGLDISYAVEAARQNFHRDPNVLICQADLLAPPFREHAFDGAFSIGVLHHTPDPQQGFREMAQTVKPGGWVAVSVYGKGGYYDFPTVKLYRRLFGTLWPVFKHYPPLLYSYFAAYLVRPVTRLPLLGILARGLFPSVRLADRQWSLLDTFDSVTPTHQSAHESYEVFSWLRSAGLEAIAPSDWGFSAYHGRKPCAE